jgi:hypothetical protein
MWCHLLTVSLTVNPRYLLKRVSSLIFGPTDKQFFTSLGPWKSVLFHRAAYIPLMSTACARYFTRLESNCCSMVRALIGCSANRFTCLLASSCVHESCHRLNLSLSSSVRSWSLKIYFSVDFSSIFLSVVMGGSFL